MMFELNEVDEDMNVLKKLKYETHVETLNFIVVKFTNNQLLDCISRLKLVIFELFFFRLIVMQNSLIFILLNILIDNSTFHHKIRRFKAGNIREGIASNGD